MTELLPCPFCGVSLIANNNQEDLYIKRHGTHYDHPEGDCFLANAELSPSMIESWNARATPADKEQATITIVLQTKRGYNGGFAQRAEPMGRVILRPGEGREMEACEWTAISRARSALAIHKEFFKCEVVEEPVTDDRAR